MTVALGRAADVSRETLDDLRAFEALVAKWTPKINLVSKSSVSELWDRHILDSLQIWPLVQQAARVVDLGSGGGFPGIVTAIAACHHAPDAQFTLIESDMRKSVFLQTAIRELSLNAQVITNRIEAAPPQDAPVITARALASCEALFAYAAPHLAENGRLVLLKGENVASELEAAREKWQFSVTRHASITQSKAVILEIEGLCSVRPTSS